VADGRPDDRTLIFPGVGGRPWSQAAYQSWRRRSFKRAVDAAGVERARPYDLRHSFASLLLAEGRSPVYVGRQLGHSPKLATDVYGHLFDEFDSEARSDPEAKIRAAREALVPATYPRPAVATGSETTPTGENARKSGQWAILDSNQGPLPYQRSALTD
jgi:Phage integrase family